MVEATVHTLVELWGVLDQVKFAPSCVNLDWHWEVEEVYGRDRQSLTFTLLGWLVNATFQRPDSYTGESRLSDGWPEFVRIGDQEMKVIKRLYNFCHRIVQHELDEAFIYKGERIFDPHKTVEEMFPRKEDR